jgi:hypothetical protein
MKKLLSSLGLVTLCLLLLTGCAFGQNSAKAPSPKSKSTEILKRKAPEGALPASYFLSDSWNVTHGFTCPKLPDYFFIFGTNSAKSAEVTHVMLIFYSVAGAATELFGYVYLEDLVLKFLVLNSEINEYVFDDDIDETTYNEFREWFLMAFKNDPPVILRFPKGC